MLPLATGTGSIDENSSATGMPNDCSMALSVCSNAWAGTCGRGLQTVR